MYKRFRPARLFAAVFMVIMLMSGLAVHASADMGPKPSITLTVKNAPNELYIIDLLENSSRGEYSEQGLGEPKETMLRTLCEYESEEGFSARMVVPVDGVSYRFAEGDGKFSYGYMTPNVFRVLIVTESGQVIVSEKIKVKAYNSSVTYDVSTGELSEDKVLVALPHIIRFLITYLGTLLVEWLVLRSFKYDFELKDVRNNCVFLLTNLATQIFMYVMIQAVEKIVFVPAEIAIVVIEAVVYSLLLRPKNREKAVLYAVFANAASFLAGIPLWFIVYFIIR